MVQITRPETIIDVSVEGYYDRKVKLKFKKNFIKEENGDITVSMTKKQTTKLINALKSQRKRKGLK